MLKYLLLNKLKLMLNIYKSIGSAYLINQETPKAQVCFRKIDS